MPVTSDTVLSFRGLSFSNRSLIIPSAESTQTEVNRAVTSKNRGIPQALMLPCWSLQQSLGCYGNGGGLTNQWLKYFGKYWYLRQCLLPCPLLPNCLGDQCHIYYLLCALQHTTAHLQVPSLGTTKAESRRGKYD